jgi:MtN3 and saliva related transmembrane protein
MDKLLTDGIGVAAAICSMTSFTPQLVKLWCEKDAGAVSLRMYVVTVTGFSLWTLYGWRLGSWPLIGSNLVSLGLSAAILVLKLRLDAAHRRKEKGPLATSGPSPRPSTAD